MLFTVVPPKFRLTPDSRGMYLERDNWNDYGFITSFRLHFATADGIHSIGTVKIAQVGMKVERFAAAETTVPTQFEELGHEFFSLGQDDSYYERLKSLGDDTRDAVLRGLRDVALDQDLFRRVQSEAVMEASLLRSVQPGTVSGQYHRIALGGLDVINYRVIYQSPFGLELEFAVNPRSHPPTNIHAIIGSNGVGKTRLLNDLMHSVVDDSAAVADVGQVLDLSGGPGRPFANVISISFSAFDSLIPVRASEAINHTYVTLDRRAGDVGHDATKQFRNAVQSLTGERRDRWIKALTTLSTDPLFDDATRLLTSDDPAIVPYDEIAHAFDHLSSGHKIIMLAISWLAELVTERTLVLIDEPETHLHPPLLAAFIRALSDLLVDRNGVAVVATHSPVVLQETPRSCVWKLRRSGSQVRADRPELETFGENVGTLTREAFGLEVTRSGFHHEVAKAVDEGLSYEDIVARFGGELGGEAKGIARALTAIRDRGSRS